MGAPAGVGAAGGAAAPAVAANAPVKPAVSPRRGMVLAVLAAAWLAVALWRASEGPGAGLVLGAVVWVGGLALFGLWTLAALWSLSTRGRMGVMGWAVVPAAVLGVGLLPWRAWLFPVRVRAAEPELRAFAEKNAWVPEGSAREVDARVGGVPIKEVGRVRGATMLRFSRSSRAENGLAYCPGVPMPDPPSWATGVTVRAVAADWYWYSWRAE
jgi:hypothetical protein